MFHIISRSSTAVLTLLFASVWIASLALAQSMPRPPLPPMVRPQMPGASTVPPSPLLLNASRMVMVPPQITSGLGLPMMMGPGYRASYPSMMMGSGYGASYPSMMGYQPYGMGMYGGQGNYGQGSGGGYGQMYSQPSYQSESQSSAEDRILGRLLTAIGVPNDDSRIRWPIGLSFLGGTRADELRNQIGALFQVAAAQAATGTVNPNVSNQLTKAIDEFRRLVHKERTERFRLSAGIYDEAERFLTKLAAANKVLKAGLGSPAPEAESKPSSGLPSAAAAGQEMKGEVSLHDNYFEPKTLSVSAGTTVQWTNRGQHLHTVTSDQGLWKSGQLRPGAVYSHTFARPGIYPYHCELHPQQMRGIIQVN